MAPVSSQPVSGMMETPLGTIDDYVFAARATGVAQRPPEGMIVHWAAPEPASMFTQTLWRNHDCADAYVAGTLGEALAKMASSQPRDRAAPDMSYLVSPVYGYVLGEDVLEMAGLDLGEAGDAVAYVFSSESVDSGVYRDAAEQLGLYSRPPVGLVAHSANAVADGGWQTIDVWRGREAAAAFYETAREKLAGGSADPDRHLLRGIELRLHTLVVAPQEIEGRSNYLSDA